MTIFPKRKKTCKNLIEANLMDTIRSAFACKRNMVPSIYETLDTIYKHSLKKAVFYCKGAKQMLLLSIHKIISTYYKITLQSLVFDKIAIFKFSCSFSVKSSFLTEILSFIHKNAK